MCRFSCWWAIAAERFRRAIQIGNFLHKTSVLTGLASLSVWLARGSSNVVFLTLAGASIATAILYDARLGRPAPQHCVTHTAGRGTG